MNQKGKDSDDFEAYREERNYRRRQRTTTERPGGTSNKVWEALNAQEEGEIHDRLLTQEVHDFFADATKMAADIVSKVAEEHEEEVGAALRDEMEEFLRETIRRASELIEVIGEDTERGEEVVEADMKNLVGKALDGFRAEGTAQLADKHMGQDPFATDVEVTTSATQPEESVQADESLGVPAQHIDEAELALAPSEPGGEKDEFTAGFVGDAKAACEIVDAEAGSEEGPEQSSEPQAPEVPQMSGPDRVKLREALKTMVRQGLMTKDEARDTYRARVGKS
ncbi:MAG: hypothetical protein ACYST0_02665 [Planctomycetota bacterium]